MSPVEIAHGRGPLVLSFPHIGTALPDEVADALNDRGRAVPDTDWHVDRLYAGMEALEPTVLRAPLSRYAVDLNRDPEGSSLYPGRATTALCPTTTFDGEPIYLPGREPDAGETARRLAAYFRPYHEALGAALARAAAAHGYAVLVDCHSIRSAIPRLFAGTLPVINIGTDDGRSCGPDLRTIAGVGAKVSGFEQVVDGRFKGGWITRHYGRPDARIFALQIELAQRAYMDERPPRAFDEAGAARLRPALFRIVDDVTRVAGRLVRGE